MNEIKEIVDHYGIETQTFVAVEELSELIKELSKYMRGNRNRSQIMEEMADVYIVLAEQRAIHDISLGEVLAVMEIKLERMKERMHESI